MALSSCPGSDKCEMHELLVFDSAYKAITLLLFRQIIGWAAWKS
ncbi:hypothetical protein COLO4_24271 [Corchorus olitorius]|uniref:Uncharacterized protein n=1 Tax=Corchorus olitorius TaxID=93759 RepID=A0A1R3IBR0_9ROSI|nr:hypothetical protein COLO4_24271 [Corchorus olitorius]